MNLRSKTIHSAIALVLVAVVLHVYLGVSFAAQTNASLISAAVSPQATAILTTQGNQPIMVNGASASSGTTILSGSSIETPPGVSASISIPGVGTITIPANSKLTLTFDQNGNLRVVVAGGCAAIQTKKGTSAELVTAQGDIKKTDSKKDDVITGCPVAGAGTGGGLSGGAKAAIALAAIGGGIGLALALSGSNSRGGNPSPARP
jgi:hypothetical protein